MNKGLGILSDIVVNTKYSRYLPERQRREIWPETVGRYKKMLVNKYGNLEAEIESNGQYILDKLILPSMRAMQFAGVAMEVNNARGYNCAYLPIDNYHSFSETMFLLLGGSGVGYSVQKQHIAQLPEIKRPTKFRRYLIQDSIIGWADSIKELMKAFFRGTPQPNFDYRDIREKGARLVTAGGKAPGPEPLKICHAHILAVLERKETGERLTSLEAHDILCHIANAVLAGGIRRSAMISLFSHDDEEMLTCKYGDWFELNEQRGRANNSAVLVRGEINKEEFDDLWKRIEASGCGEPGVYWTNDRELGTNPCCEISLMAYQFCNLCEINVDNILSQEDLNNRARVAAFFGTIQASFTDFHYLRPIWKKTTEKEALLGIGMTGIGSGKILQYDLKEACVVAMEENVRMANVLGINPAARVTTVKPSGTTSCVLGCSSGIHAWFAEYYIRTVRFSLGEDISSWLMVNHPELCEVDILRPKDTLCVRIPIKAPKGSILRYESALDTLERVKKFSTQWVKMGHRSGDNTNNVSATIYINKERMYYRGKTLRLLDSYNPLDPSFKNEWEAVGEWMWENKEFYNGLSVLPFDGGTYSQAPFEEIDKEEYERRVEHLTDLDLSKIIELDDNVNFTAIAACAGGQCEINM